MPQCANVRSCTILVLLLPSRANCAACLLLGRDWCWLQLPLTTHPGFVGTPLFTCSNSASATTICTPAASPSSVFCCSVNSPCGSSITAIESAQPTSASPSASFTICATASFPAASSTNHFCCQSSPWALARRNVCNEYGPL